MKDHTQRERTLYLPLGQQSRFDQAVRAHFGAFGHGGGGHGRVPAGGQPVGRDGGQGPRETGGKAVAACGSLAFEQAGGHFSSTTSTITDWK